MSTFSPLWSWALIAAFLAWVGVSGWLLVGRAFGDVRHRSIRQARKRLARIGGEALAPGTRQARVHALLSRLPRRAVERVAADGSAPDWLADTFAAHAMERWGADRLTRGAGSHRGENSRWRRIAYLRILSGAGHRYRLPLLHKALHDRDRDVSGTAASLLGELRDQRAAELLVEALRQHMHSQSRVAAQLDAFPLDIPDLIVPLTRSDDASVRFWGALLLARYAETPGVEDALVPLVADREPMVRKAAVDSLGRFSGEQALEGMLGLLDDPVWFVRAHAARSLGETGRADLAARVLPLLADPEWWVRAAAKDALQSMGPEAAQAVASCLDHPDRFARNGAAEVLQNLGLLGQAAGRIAADTASEADVALLRAAAAAGGTRLARGIVERAGSGDQSRRQRLHAALASQGAVTP